MPIKLKGAKLIRSIEEYSPTKELFVTLLPLVRINKNIMKRLFSMNDSPGKKSTRDKSILEIFTKTANPKLTTQDIFVEDIEKFIAATYLHGFDKILGHSIPAIRFI